MARLGGQRDLAEPTPLGESHRRGHSAAVTPACRAWYQGVVPAITLDRAARVRKRYWMCTLAALGVWERGREPRTHPIDTRPYTPRARAASLRLGVLRERHMESAQTIMLRGCKAKKIHLALSWSRRTGGGALLLILLATHQGTKAGRLALNFTP